MYPETFCQEVREKGDDLLKKGDDLLNGIKSKAKDVVNSKVEEEVDSIMPTE